MNDFQKKSVEFLSSQAKRGSRRISLRYKLTFPVIIFVSLMLFVLFYTTFNLVRTLILNGIEERLSALTTVFTETLKEPLIKEEYEDLTEILNWMGAQANVTEVRIENWEGKIIAQIGRVAVIPPTVLKSDYAGVSKVTADSFVVASKIQAKDRLLGRLVVVYSGLGVEHKLKQIFQERLLIAFLMVMILALLVMLVTWIAIRPLFSLEKVSKRILAGDLDARAALHSFDEIEDVSDAFDEMLNRLGQSLDRLRLRTEALEESEEKYRLFVENASDIIFSLTPEGELILLNRGFSGCSRDEFLHEGLPLILSLHTAESRLQFQQALEDVTRTKSAISNVSVTHILRGSKTEIFYLINFTPVLGHENELKFIQAVMRDITELKRIEIMKESLVRDVAHELKTPAAKFSMAIAWFEKEMEKQQEVGKYHEILSILKNNINRLMQTITSIMDLSKLEAGMDRITKTALNLNDILLEVSNDMRSLIEEKKIKFEFNLPKDAIPVKGDAHMLYRLFTNLLQNSLKFSTSGKIRFSAWAGEGLAHVAVEDTGCGIELDNLESIFDRFVQKTASSSGIGVGLTICRDIAALHDGKIWAESEGAGKGAAFHVTLPIV